MTIDWSKSHCGVMLCDYNKTIELMPESEEVLKPLFDSGLLELPKEDYVIDIKVHMLMPHEFPCIPNWHCDFIPRDSNGKKDESRITGEKMYLWVSGTPRTEFREKPEVIKPGGFSWAVMDQRSEHRGVMSTEFTWRCFMRVIPRKFIHASTKNVGTLRRHTQVYLDANNYTW